MQPQSTPARPAPATQPSPDPAPIPIKQGVAVLYGYGIHVSVWRRHLVCRDGIGPARREGRYHHATSGLRRLVILGTDGSLTLEAIHWLRQAKAALIQLDG